KDPGRANRNGTIFCNWVADSVLDVIAPDHPTQFPHRGAQNSILGFAIAKNLSNSNISSFNKVCNDHNPIIIDLLLSIIKNAQDYLLGEIPMIFPPNDARKS
ncbi:hypothetical protein NPIL_530591, partial [Nephila pilipes]